MSGREIHKMSNQIQGKMMNNRKKLKKRMDGKKRGIQTQNDGDANKDSRNPRFEPNHVIK